MVGGALVVGLWGKRDEFGTAFGSASLLVLGAAVLLHFAADIDVQGGDILGFWSGLLASCTRVVDSGGGLILAGGLTDPSVGDVVSLPVSSTQRDLNESANLVTTPPPTIADLIDSVEALDLHGGIENGLLKKLTNAQRSLDAGNTANACSQLASFINQVGAQSGKKIDVDDAADLIAEAEAVRESLGCRGG